MTIIAVIATKQIIKQDNPPLLLGIFFIVHPSATAWTFDTNLSILQSQPTQKPVGPTPPSI